MTPLETQLLAALRLRRATSFPFTDPPVGLGLARTEENASTAAWSRRNAEADKAVDEAIAAGEREEGGGWLVNDGRQNVAGDTLVDVRLITGIERGGRSADTLDWSARTNHYDGALIITHWRLAA